MHRAVIDTNVFISGGTVSTGVPANILNHWRNQNFIMVVSPQLLEEYRDVLSRPEVLKITHLTPQENARYIQEISEKAYMTSGNLILSVLTKDPDDNMVLACAEEGMATHIVTKNIKDFPPKKYNEINIVTPIEFLHLLE